MISEIMILTIFGSNHIFFFIENKFEVYFSLPDKKKKKFLLWSFNVSIIYGLLEFNDTLEIMNFSLFDFFGGYKQKKNNFGFGELKLYETNE